MYRNAPGVFFITAWLVTVSVNCTTHVTIELEGYSTASSEPSQGAVHPYLADDERIPEQGPLVQLLFSSETDLERAAKRKAHHLYYDLRACGSNEGLSDGAVFRATKLSRATEPGSSNYYRVFVPLDLDRITQAASGIGGLDLSAELATAREQGLCLRVGGAQMWGVAIFSNFINIPVALVGDTIVIDRENEMPQPSLDWSGLPNHRLKLTVTPLACASAAPAA